MLRHAAYREEFPWLNFARDAAGELRRPVRLLQLTVLVGAAAHFGVPVERAVPGVVKTAYADARGWQTENAAKLSCLEHHSAAVRSSDLGRIEAAETLCTELEVAYGR